MTHTPSPTKSGVPDTELWGCGHPPQPLSESDAALGMAHEEHPEMAGLLRARPGRGVAHGGKVLRQIPGAGKVYDWRGTTWTEPMVEGKIHHPVIFTHHIPVVPNTAGIADFFRLRDVLVAQGYGVQFSTDREGNVALFCDFDDLCWQARGANAFGPGCEHMHMTVSESWTEKQFRAAAWLVNQLKNKHGVPASNARLGPGNGVVDVLEGGQATHQDVSDKAGYHDREDPGKKYRRGHVRDLVIWYREHGESFTGAPS